MTTSKPYTICWEKNNYDIHEPTIFTKTNSQTWHCFWQTKKIIYFPNKKKNTFL